MPKNYLTLDNTTRRNLEIFAPIMGEANDASLLAVLDETVTPMGARLLRAWLARPLRSKERINHRLDAIELLSSQRELRDKLRMEFRELGDIERLVGRFASARILSPRDFLMLKFSLWHIPEIKQLVGQMTESTEATQKQILTTVHSQLEPLGALAEEIDKIIAPEPPVTIAHLGIIRDGANTELDELRSLTRNSRERLANIQARERERTGISSLKVDYNNVFGYYIEVSKANAAKVPEDYERRQTMTNAERYITQELKEYEAKILGAEERMQTIEREMIEQLRARILEDTQPLQRNAELIAVLDVLATFSTLATKNNWTRPQFNDDWRFLHRARPPSCRRKTDARWRAIYAEQRHVLARRVRILYYNRAEHVRQIGVSAADGNSGLSRPCRFFCSGCESEFSDPRPHFHSRRSKR